MQLDSTNYCLQVIPIEGDFTVNDEPQKTFEEILPEIVISKYVQWFNNVLLVKHIFSPVLF